MAYRFSKLDAAENAFFERQLEFVRSQSFDVKYPELLGRELVPVDNTVDPGAETVKYNQYDPRTMAIVLASYADDIPRSDIVVKEFRQAVKGLASGYAYSVQEIRAAKMAGMPLEQRRANAARLAIEQRIDKISAVGDANNGMVGLLNNPNALSYTLPNGAVGASQLWSTKTGLEILLDLTAATNKIVDTTNGVEIPNTVVIPITQYGQIATLPLQAGASVTILQHFLQANPYIRSVVPWFRTKAAGAAGKDRMVVYRRDPGNLQLVIPQEFESFPPEQEGLQFKVACHARIAGVVYYYPLSELYADGL